MGFLLILGLLASAAALCPSTTFKDPVTPPAAPVFPTQAYTGAMPTSVLQDHWSEVAKIGAYRPPRIIPCATPTRTNCPHLATGLKNWHDPATWGGTIPTSGTVTIPAGSKVLVASCSINPNTIWDRINIPSGAELIFADADISIKTKSMNVDGTLTIGSTTCRLQSKITIELGPATRAVDTTGLTKGIAVQGTIDVHGVEYAPTWTRLAATAKVGDTTIFVQDMVNWEVGQEIVITTTELKDSRDFNHNEVKVIAKVETTSYPQVAAVTLTTALAYKHYGGPEYQAEVALLSRRIKIQGDAASEPTDTANSVCTSPGTQSTYPCENTYLTGFGGHVLINGPGAAGRIQGVELFRMGQTNMLGRYPLHFHLVGDVLNTNRALFRDNAVHHSFFRCYAVHGTHGVQVSRNVGYDAIGHCFFIEDGIEENSTFTYNMGSHIHPLGPYINPSHYANNEAWWSQGLSWYTETANMVLPSDMSAAPFYITNPYNDFIGNAASGGWTGFAMPTLLHPVKLFESVTNLASHNRPFRSPFRGNSAHSSGFWFQSAGAFYVGGMLRHQSPGGILEYTAGRSDGKDTCSDPTVGTTPNDGCWTQSEQLWLRFEDNKAFLANRGLQNWGERSELIRFEFHNVGLAMNVFGKVLIDQMLMECRTQSTDSIPAWFSGCNTPYTASPAWGVCNVRDYQFFESFVGFQWYDVGQMHILTNSTFRNCRSEWAPCVYGPTPGVCDGVSVFLSLTHSDQFIPQTQQLTTGIKLDNCGKKWAFTTKLTDGGKDTVSGRLQSWVDFDGSMSGGDSRYMLGSAWAGNWWKYNSQCSVPAGTSEFWSCKLAPKDSYVSIYFGYNIGMNVEWPSSVGNTNCLNGGQSGSSLCPIIGNITHFGRPLSDGMPVALNAKVTGPYVGCSGGWFLQFKTPPQTLTMQQVQIDPDINFMLAIAYPPGTTFTINYKSASWCATSWAVCTHPVTAVSSVAAVQAGFGDKYYWDNAAGLLWIRVVQRQSILAYGSQSADAPWTSLDQPEFTFRRNTVKIIEVAYNSFLQIITGSAPAAFTAAVPAALDSSCAAVADCPVDQGWPATNAGASRIIPCATGFTGNRLRTCLPTGNWGAENATMCKPGNNFCPAQNGWDLTPPGMLSFHNCPCGQSGSDTRQCDANGVWGSTVVACSAAPTCTDNIQNGQETAIDCGGPTCPACTYCQTIVCGSHGTCVEGNPPTCTCTGGWTGSRCDVMPPDPCANNTCSGHGTCTNGACTCTGGYTGTDCATPPPPTCTDGIKNQDELNIDCGGTKCPACPSYSWAAGNWSTCTLTCGSGTQTRSVVCQDQTAKVVADTFCDAAHPVPSSQACNVDPCPVYSWNAGSWSPCSTSCGGGNQTRPITCISSIGNSVVANTQCDAATQPSGVQTCNTDPCAANRWVSGQWGMCTMSCGGGTQTRSVTCLTPADTPAPSASCTDPMPSTTQSCNLVACATYSWKSCPTFYPCTAQCNGGGAMVGVQYRDVFCFRDQDLQAVDNSLCTSPQPTSQISVCNTQKCTGVNWMADANWGPCVQGTDGVYVRKRTFHCHNADGSTALYSLCVSSGGPMPIAVLPCTPGTCSDANGCPNVQIGALFNDCVNGLAPCGPQCADASAVLADQLQVLGLTPARAAQCATSLADSMPASFKPSPSLLSSITGSLASGQKDVCGGLSASSHVVVSWSVLLALAYVVTM